MRLALSTIGRALVTVLALFPVRANELSSDEERYVAAIQAVDVLCALSEFDLAVLIRQQGRAFLSQIGERGKTLLDSRQWVRREAERIVNALGEVKGKNAEAALLMRELWHLADAESEMVTGLDPIDEAFAVRAKELAAKTAEIRARLKPLLTGAINLTEPVAPIP